MFIYYTRYSIGLPSHELYMYPKYVRQIYAKGQKNIMPLPSHLNHTLDTRVYCLIMYILGNFKLDYRSKNSP